MLRDLLHSVLRAFNKDRISKAGTGAAIGALLAFTLYVCIFASYIQTGLNSFLNILLLACLTIGITLFLFLFTMVAYRLIRRVRPVIFSIIFTLILLVILLPDTFFSLPFILTQTIFGALLGLVFSNNTKKIWRVLVVIIVVLSNIFIFYFLQFEGRDKTILVTKSHWKQKASEVKMENPATTGQYSVEELFYGSGNDKHRAEYGEKVSIKTTSVDATSFFDQSKGIKNSMRKFYWGFNSKNYPINARVWYPSASGKFPLVLVVHGNHLMSKNSDQGYEYLGRLLASKGYIVASIDENFLNLAWFGDYYFSELFIRSWLILRHLENWRAWNETPESFFYNKVDINNIALIGHSRGAEAASIATLINKMQQYTLNANEVFDFQFSIKGIVQMAPTDVYTLQADAPVELKNINYLLLHGGYDQDMYWNAGSRIFNKIAFNDSAYHFKTSLYIFRANHGQFNTVWGRRDDRPPMAWFLNTKSILPEQKQREIAQVYISAFLEATLKGRNEYISLFKDYRNALPFLPKDYYINMFADSRSRYLATFNEDIQVTTATQNGWKIEGTHLKKWKEDAIPLRTENGSTQNNAGVILGWDQRSAEKKTASYALKLIDTDTKFNTADSAKSLVFDVCNNTNDINDIDFTIEIVTKSGKALTTLKDHLILPPLLETSLTKRTPFYRIKSESNIERVMQYVQIPFDKFTSSPVSFHASEIIAIRFIFDKTVSGEIFLDNIGFY